MTRTSFTNCPDCHSGSCLDEFTARLFNFKRDGTYVDIGSQHSMYHNNSYFLNHKLNWKGITVEIEDQWDSSYNDRKNHLHINDDATKIDYERMFKYFSMPESIDFLSIDVDILSLDVVKLLPHNNYGFKVIGIEHDAYLYGDKYREPQREFITDLGYVLACANIYVRNPTLDEAPFEDWYLDPNYFDWETINRVTCSGAYGDDIVNKLK